MVYKPLDGRFGIGKSHRVSAELMEETHIKLLQMCEKNKVSVNKLVRHMIEHCIEESEEEKNARNEDD